VIQNKNTELRIYYDKEINKFEHKVDISNKKLCKYKKSRDFHFNSDNDKHYFIFVMRKNYFNLMKRHLLLESIKIS
jgi:hypothetical protein